jgi:hypothetical protein
MESLAIALLMGTGALLNLTVGSPVVTQAHAESRVPPTTQQVESSVKQSLEQMTAYTNKDKAITLAYPKNWDEIEPKDGPILWKARAFNGLVSTRLGSDDLPDKTTLDTYVTATNAAVKEAMAQQKMPITVLEESRTEVASAPAAKITYTYKLAGVPATVKVLQILIVKGARGYVFNYTAQNELYDDFLPVIESMIKSIRLL